MSYTTTDRHVSPFTPQHRRPRWPALRGLLLPAVAYLLIGLLAIALTTIVAATQAATPLPPLPTLMASSSHQPAAQPAADRTYCREVKHLDVVGLPTDRQIRTMARLGLHTTGRLRAAADAYSATILAWAPGATEHAAVIKICNHPARHHESLAAAIVRGQTIGIDGRTYRAVPASAHTCSYHRARVVCVNQQPRRVCRAALNVARCWGFAGSDTAVVFTWAGRVATS